MNSYIIHNFLRNTIGFERLFTIGENRIIIVKMFTNNGHGTTNEINRVKKLAFEQAEIYRVFSNEKRILIFWLLAENEMSVQDLADTVGTSIQNTSQHLRLMKSKSILESRRDGNTILYRVSDSEIGQHCLNIHRINLKESKNNDQNYTFPSF